MGIALNGRQYDDFNLNTELNTNPELNINYVLQYANIHFSVKQYSTDSIFTPIQLLPTGIANPRSWELSVLGMMRFASVFPASYAASTLNDTANNGAGFYAAYNQGNSIQSAVAQCTVEAGTLFYTASPLFANLILNQDLKASALNKAIVDLEIEKRTLTPDAMLKDIVTYVKTQWNTTNPTPNGQTLQNAAKALSGSKKLLDAFVNFGLGRSLEGRDLLSSLLYSPQSLPSGDQVLTLYQNWLDAPTAVNPRLTFFNTAPDSTGNQQTRKLALSQMILGFDTPTVGGLLHTDGIIDRIVRDANYTGLRLGEPLPAVDAMLNRFAFFRRTAVTGTVRPDLNRGTFVPGQPVTLTFASAEDTFVVPVMLDNNGGFTVWLPPSVYVMGAKAERFLQRRFDTIIDTRRGSFPSVNNPGTLDLKLFVGDVTGHNLVNNTDLILLRNAYGSTPASPNWNELADLNGDGIVNNTDLILLRNNFSKKGDRVP